MTLTIEDLVLTRFPHTLLGVVVARGLDNTYTSPTILTLLDQAQDSLAARFGSAPVTEHPAIAPWREAYRAFGARPKDHPSSIENLVRRVLKGHRFGSINPLVDLYNAVSLTHLVPAGGEDLETLRGDLVLRFATAGEPAVRLLGEAEERPPNPGEVIYADQLGAVCRRWNWKEAERTKLTAATRNAVLVIEAVAAEQWEAVRRATGELAERVREHCGGEVTIAILDLHHPTTFF